MVVPIPAIASGPLTVVATGTSSGTAVTRTLTPANQFVAAGKGAKVTGTGTLPYGFGQFTLAAEGNAVVTLDVSRDDLQATGSFQVRFPNDRGRRSSRSTPPLSSGSSCRATGR